MADVILENPGISQGEIARHFGYTQGWVSQVIHSDSFIEYLASRKAALTDPTLAMALEERLTGLAHRSIDVLMNQLDMKESAEVALKALELTTRARNYGAGVNIQNNFIALMPQKAQNGEKWMEEHNPRLQPAFGGGRMHFPLSIDLDTVIDVANG